MSYLTTIRRWGRRAIRSLRQLLPHPSSLTPDLDEEIRSHVEMRTQANLEAGMSPENARYAALRQFGWVESTRERCRDQRGVSWIENFAQDTRYGVRMLVKNPGFTAVAVLTLCNPLKESGRGASIGRRSGRLRAMLVVVEVALALMMLVGRWIAHAQLCAAGRDRPGL